MVSVPGAMPMSWPAVSMVASEALLLAQAPPGTDAERVRVSPGQMLSVPVMVPADGSASMVMMWLAVEVHAASETV